MKPTMIKPLPDIDEIWPARFPCSHCRSTHPVACAWRQLDDVPSAHQVTLSDLVVDPAAFRCRCSCHYSADELEASLERCGFLAPDLVTRCELPAGHDGNVHQGMVNAINRVATWNRHTLDCTPFCPACQDEGRREGVRTALLGGALCRPS